MAFFVQNYCHIVSAMAKSCKEVVIDVLLFSYALASFEEYCCLYLTPITLQCFCDIPIPVGGSFTAFLSH